MVVRTSWFAGLMALVVLCFASPALAKGTVRVHNPQVDEENGEWKIKLTIDYGTEPHIAHVPMRFVFKPIATYERALTDESPEKPVERRVALQGQKEISLPMDVGFADAMGKTFKITKFSVKLSRDADFEAGEYEMTVKLVEGGQLGQKTTLKLKGNNKAIDRRSMVFTASPVKKKEKPAEDKQAAPTDTKPKAVEDYGPDLGDVPDISSEEAEKIEDPNAPPSVEQKQGGCGCEVVGRRGSIAWLAILPVAAVWLRRFARRSV